MGFYKNPKEMYTARAERFRRDGNTHWAQAKNAAKAEQARAGNAVFRCGRKKGGR